MAFALLPWLSGFSPVSAVWIGSYASSILPRVPSIARHFIRAADIESQKDRPDFKRAFLRESASTAAGFAVQGFFNFDGLKGFSRVVDVAASGFHAIHQWMCVQEASRKVVATIRGEPTSDDLRVAALSGGAIVDRTSPLVQIIPAINRLGINLLKFVYYCADVKRSTSDTDDQTCYVVNNISAMGRLIETQPKYLEGIAQWLPNVNVQQIKEQFPRLIEAFKAKKADVTVVHRV